MEQPEAPMAVRRHGRAQLGSMEISVPMFPVCAETRDAMMAMRVALVGSMTAT